MYIGKLLMAKRELDYTTFVTAGDRQCYQERIANEMYELHLKAINQCKQDPVFYVDHIESKINVDEYDELTWEDIIYQDGSDDAKKKWKLLANEFEKHDVPEYVSIKPKPVKQVAYKKPSFVKHEEPVKFERQKGTYSNTQWNKINEDDI